MTIDCHQHFWRYDPERDGWITAEMGVLKRDFLPNDLGHVLTSNSIHGCVSVQAAQSDAETHFLLQLAERNEFIKGVVGWIDLQRDDLEEQLEHCSKLRKLKGFRHVLQSEPKGFMLNPKFIRGLKKLTAFGFTYDLLIYHHQLEEALKLLSETANVKIVIDHMAKPSIRTQEKTHWELNMAAAGSFENVYCKLSGMVTEADWHHWKTEDFFPYLDEVFEVFGPKRVMYGSDWPVCLLAGSYESQLGVVASYISALTEEEKENVMGKNAERFYNLY